MGHTARVDQEPSFDFQKSLICYGCLKSCKLKTKEPQEPVLRSEHISTARGICWRKCRGWELQLCCKHRNVLAREKRCKMNLHLTVGLTNSAGLLPLALPLVRTIHFSRLVWYRWILVWCSIWYRIKVCIAPLKKKQTTKIKDLCWCLFVNFLLLCDKNCYNYNLWVVKTVTVAKWSMNFVQKS